MHLNLSVPTLLCLLATLLPAASADGSVAGGESAKFWQRDFSSAGAYEKSVQTNRDRLRTIIGAVDARQPAALEVVTNTAAQPLVAETEAFTVQAVRWPTFEGVFGEGLWLQSKAESVARVVAIPDADQTPEMLVGLTPGLAPERQFARRLAENGCEVLVPVLICRQAAAPSNELNRERICRQASEAGRHIIGYEVQKVLAAVDAFNTESSGAKPQGSSIGVAGYGEGGLIAFYSGALDSRIQASVVSGCFDSRQRLAQEPIYRQIFGLLTEFGDAEVATLIAPRCLIVEFSRAPAKLRAPDYESVEAEVERARSLLKPGDPKLFDRLKLICGNEGMATGPGSDRALAALLNALGASVEHIKQPAKAPTELRADFAPAERQQRQAKELEIYTQKLLAESERARTNSSPNKSNP